MKENTTFSLKEDAFIGDNFLMYPVKKLAKKMNRSQTGIMNRLKSLGLEIPDEIRELNIRAGRYKRGTVPLNKGKKQKDYMSAEGIRKSA